MTPTISVTFDADAMQHVIMATSHGRTEPFGARILRGGTHPDVRGSHDTAEGAEKDAAKIRAYLATISPRKISKTAARKEGA